MLLFQIKTCYLFVDAVKNNKLVITEDVPVSDDVKNYVKELENRTTCTQILGMFIRSSWMRILFLENEEEAKEVMIALVKLTRVRWL